ncbi:uncharacterized protein VTP21DRAFT_4440 [Calcarisporiella thermophila]|uniref:uncharacterized protein n=1 Tax=Calcarisporiella thermophila TaxID=911321 RepID=UPI0037439DE1
MMFSKLPIFVTALSLISLVSAHMEMEKPAPRRSKFSKFYSKNSDIDFDMTSPLGGRFTFPCRGFKEGPAESTFKAGDTVPVSIVGGAPHGGGHCQFALSYDKGKTFVVIQDEMETCPLERNYNIKIPNNAPSGKAVFAWTWVNAIGNREYYMNCADVNIVGSQNGKLTGKELLVVNLPGRKTIPEFAGNKNTGKDLFAQRKTITVSGNGDVEGSPQEPEEPEEPETSEKPEKPTNKPTKSPSNPTPTKDPKPTNRPTKDPKPTNKPTKTSKPTKPSKTSEPSQPTGQPDQPENPENPETPGNGQNPGNGKEECQPNTMECDSEGKSNGFKMCRFGKWVKMACPAATVCKEQSKEGNRGVFCGYRRLRLF